MEVDLPRLAAARASGRIDKETYRRGAEVLLSSPDAETWRTLLDRAALVAGSVALVAGIIYLVAWNWGALGYLTKLLLTGGIFAAACGIGLLRGGDRLAGRIAMGSAGFLVGPLLVVYSQAYQTGADPWLLFATWGILLLPFALASRLQGVWLFGAILANITLITWWILNYWGFFFGDETVLWLPIVVAASNAAMIAAWEAQGIRQTPGRVVPRALATWGLICLLAPALVIVVELDHIIVWVAVIALFFTIVAIQGIYWMGGRDMYMVAISIGAGMVWATTILCRILLEIDDEAWILWFPVLGFALVGQGIGLVLWIRAGGSTTRAESLRQQLLDDLEEDGVQWR